MSMQFFDLHCDTIYRCEVEKEPLYDNNFHISLKKAKQYSPWVQCFAIWIPNNVRGIKALELFNNCLKKFNKEIEDNSKFMLKCTSNIDFQKVLQTGKNGAILTIEGGAALNGDVNNLYYFKECGVRIITLTWNGSCEIGDGSNVLNSKGITVFGKEVIKKMDELNIIIDISHASDRLFYDVIELINKPFIATHSNSRTICNHKRNLTDEQFKIIRDFDGLVGVNLCKNFLRLSGEADFSDIDKHIDHFLSLGGENIISMGCDFDGADVPYDVKGIESIELIYEYLLKKNYSESILKKIFFDNAYNFFNTNML